MNLNFRQLEPELMDDPELDANAHQQALNGLARTHVFTRTARRIWSEIVAAIPSGKRRTISILDVGCGDGFLLRQIEQLAIQAGYSATLHGCDFSRTALELARTASEKHNPSQIRFVRCGISRCAGFGADKTGLRPVLARNTLAVSQPHCSYRRPAVGQSRVFSC